MLHHRKLINYIFLSVLMLAVGGCGGRSAPTSFFILSAIDDTPEKVIKPADFNILVGPVTVARYLDRDQIVIRDRDTEVVLDEFNQWAEPLADNLKRVVVENLSILLGTSEIYDIDRHSSKAVDFQLSIDVHRFDIDSEGSALLMVFWSVIDDKQVNLKREKRVLRRQVKQEDMPGAYVSIQNDMVAELSTEIANELISLSKD